MSTYDYGVKRIAKAVGLTGVEAKHIAMQMKAKNLDVEAIDWEGAISDANDSADRYKSVKRHLWEYSGISLETPSIETDELMRQVHNVQGRRSHRSIALDNALAARHTFKATNPKGISLWLKAPNMYDIIGVDDFINIPHKKRG